MLEHNRNNSFEDRTVDFQARVIIDLDKPGLKIPVNHKIKPKYLKVILMPFMIQNLIVGFDNAASHLFQFG